MLEIVLRLLAVTISAILLIGFGWYFSFGTDTLQHDWIYFGGGVLSLLSGLAMLPFVVMVFRQLREYGSDGIISDVGYPELRRTLEGQQLEPPRRPQPVPSPTLTPSLPSRRA